MVNSMAQRETEGVDTELLLQQAFDIVDGKSEQPPTREHLVGLHAYYWRMLTGVLARLEKANSRIA